MEEQFRRWRSEDRIYQEQIPIVLNMLDCNGRFKASELLRAFAIVASDDFTEMGLSYDYILERGYYFVITRASARVLRDPRDTEIVTMRTWPYKVKGMQVTRCYEMVGDDGAVIVSGQEIFMIIETATNHPIRIDDFPLMDWYLVARNPLCEDCKRIKAKLFVEELATVRATFSELDVNGHVNNACYTAYAYDNFPPALQNRRWTDVMIGFDSETRIGEDLILYLTADSEDCLEGEWVQVVGRKEDGTPSFGCAYRFEG